MRIQSVVLEYHRDVSVLRLHVIYNPVANLQFAGRDVLKTRDHTECSRLTTTRRSYEDDELFVSNLEIKILNCLESIGVNFTNIF